MISNNMIDSVFYALSKTDELCFSRRPPVSWIRFKKCKMKIIRNNIIPFKGYSAIMLFGLLFVRKNVKITDIMLAHEETHLKQMLGMGVIPFYLWYCVEYLIRLCVTRSTYLAYSGISFERDARIQATEAVYLGKEKRNYYSWIKYVFKKNRI